MPVSVNVNGVPTQSVFVFAAMVPAVGNELTVAVVVAAVPQPFEYVIVVVPPKIPVTVPDTDPIVPVLVLLLLHVPPGVASLRVAVPPIHTLTLPLIATGCAFTVTILFAVAAQLPVAVTVVVWVVVIVVGL
jgi:hypothetical protein